MLRKIKEQLNNGKKSLWSMDLKSGHDWMDDELMMD